MDDLHKFKVGIMGGTFDPIHYGHLYIAECSRHSYGLAKVLFLPSGQPVHKNRPDIIDPAHRVRMTRLAIESNPFFSLSTVEVDRLGPTYTVDTLEQLHEKSAGTEEFYFITGADAIMEILTWKDVARVFGLCRFIAVTRPGYSLAALNKILNDLTPGQRAKIHIHETGGTLISSTEIRMRVSHGEPIKYLVPEGVERYIITEGLYIPKINME
ncbi:MAG: nicotinate-nucleotide adenylyltransferase [Eubacteriales bacterium]|nr:MAG: nicotinic acid mononucleotide adenylyltransferase [Firmicutes bacterium HGW-Firmicutes-8]